MPSCFGFTDLSNLISETLSIFFEMCLHYKSKAIALPWALLLCKLSEQACSNNLSVTCSLVVYKRYRNISNLYLNIWAFAFFFKIFKSKQ